MRAGPLPSATACSTSREVVRASSPRLMLEV
ncbi:Uncharacterised protein [Bordetella pertussis]|nr:Uncharacterised protein [Bordetella pertussis]